MPAVISRPPRPAPFTRVPSRVALALEPELNRRVIPARITLDANAPPFAGELREDQHGTPVDCPPGSITTLATLRRPWNFVGFSVNQGDLADRPGCAVTLRVLTRAVNGFVINQGLPAALAGSSPVAFVGLVVGAICEVVFFNETVGPAFTVHGVSAAIWGMGEF
jgi:hypothetical protein